MKADTRQPFETLEGGLVEPWDPSIDLEAALVRLAGLPHCLFLDSARRDPLVGPLLVPGGRSVRRTSSVPADGTRRAGRADATHRRLGAPPRSTGLPPFQGGAAGLFGYDLGRSLEKLPAAAHRRISDPGAGDRPVRRGAGRRSRRAPGLDHLARFSRDGTRCTPPARRRAARAVPRLACRAAAARAARDIRALGFEPLPLDGSRRSSPVPGPAGLTSNFSAERVSCRRFAGRSNTSTPATSFRSTLRSGCCARRATTRSRCTCGCGGAIRPRSPAISTWATTQIVSASPERFLKVRERPGRGPADQGHAAAHRPARGRSVRRRRAAAERKGSGRKRDDRRPAAQRPVARLPRRQRARHAALRLGNL